MTSLLVSSMMVGQGLENALMTAIAFEVQDPSAILKPGLESPVPLLQLVQQLVGNSTSRQTTCLKKVWHDIVTCMDNFNVTIRLFASWAIKIYRPRLIEYRC